MPRPTAIALLATLAVTAGALAAFLAQAPVRPASYLVLFASLFALRVVGQVWVAAFAPSWLPPMGAWNLVPYRVLLPVQLVLLVVLAWVVAGPALTGPTTGRALVVSAFVYWIAMGARYAVRMARRPDQRWLGGAIPIVFHCVLAAFLFVHGASQLG